MGTFLIVLVVVGTLIALGTRFSLYLYKSGALEHSHSRHARRLYPVTVGAVPANDPSYIDLIEKHKSMSRRARIALFLAIVLLVVAIFAIVLTSIISAVFS